MRLRIWNLTLTGALLLALFNPIGLARADDTPPPELVVIPGTLQSAVGCSGDWQTECESTALIYNADKDVWEGTFNLPAGAYEYKVALNGSWAENYGLNGVRDGPNIPLVLAEDTAVTFTYDHKTHQVTDSVTSAGGGAVAVVVQPDQAVIAGTLQSEAGCPGDWQPECANTALAFDEEDGVWQGTFTVAPGDDQDKNGSRYKTALNGSWSVNYGANAQSGGADIPLAVTEPTQVKFYYDHATHWVADNINAVIAVASGTFQSELGCANDHDPSCLRSWLQDPDGDGLYTFSTRALPPGDYEFVVAIGESDAETYGEGGALGGAALSFTIVEGNELYIGYNAVTKQITLSTEGAPRGNLSAAKALWISQDTIAWDTPRPAADSVTTYALFYAGNGGLKLTPEGVAGGEFIPLKFNLGGLPFTEVQKRPFINGFSSLKIDAADFEKIPDILKSQMAVAVLDKDGRVIDATGLQLPGVLDDLYTYTGPLGVTFDGDVPTLRVWAPTAQSVALMLLTDNPNSDNGAELPMTWDKQTGVWSITGAPDWKGQFYLYKVQVYVRSPGNVETNFVTDPYSFSLSMNSQRSQIVDLNDPALKPEGWDGALKPALAAPEDAVIYELHLRDFSINDSTVPEELRGTFAAFTVGDSNGMKHLKALAEAGLTHVHLLPVFDIASVNEDKTTWQTIDQAALAALPPDSDEQSLAVQAISGNDGFNWGYDPYHYTAPEGSYSTNPNGSTRILEFRQMVQALNAIGLRVVMDVVYNHTNASGQNDKSVLDKVVPGYYHRLNADGLVETSTCCQNTATEHAMMEKLMIDSVTTWATAYKVDGFRFDLMGHHMLANMVNLRSALDTLTPAQNGVDGKAIYVYGEGWDFGEVASGKRGKNATQLNIGGTGIGVFNDRLRDAVRGGGPFDDPRLQGFLTGLFTAPSDFATSEAEQKIKLLQYTDWIRIGLAGNLKDYELVNAQGQSVTSERISYNGSPAGYTLDPQENIVYISAHDNETLFDAIQWKAPVSATLADRVRMNNLGLSLVALSQGVPFFHAGDDLLRSKSLDRNTYNSGDWYNKLDFTYQSNNWGVGLPIEGKDRWDLMRPLLADPELQATEADILAASNHFREMLAIRQSSPLFRLQTAEAVTARLSFLNTGPDQIPGLIVMNLLDTMGDDLDPAHHQIVVLFNASPDPVTFADATLAGLALELHPIQQASADATVKESKYDAATGAFTLPGRTAAVFVVAQEIPPTVAPQATATQSSTVVLPVVSSEGTTPTAPATNWLSWVIGVLAALGLGAGAFWAWNRRAKR